MPQEEYLPPILVIQQGPDIGKSFSLNKDIITIGSTGENDIVINDPDVSQHHALISKSEGDWVIEDLGSKSGVWVNARRVKQPVYLRQGTRINLGPNVMLTAQGEALGIASAKKSGGCARPTLFGLIGIVLLAIILLAGTVIVGYFYLYPQYSKAPDFNELLPNSGPAVTIIEPSPGEEFPIKSSFLVFVSARDEKGISRIDLWVDDQIAVSQSSPTPEGTNPLSLVHEMVTEKTGSYVLVAHAYNNEGDMGASQAIVITVTDQQGDTDPAKYIAKDGDTIDSVAQKTNKSASDIQQANPGIKNKLKPGQNVNIPNPPHPPLPTPPPSSGSGIGYLPGIKPADIPGAAKMLPGFNPGDNTAVMPAIILPKKDTVIGNIVIPVNPPESLKADIKDCKVTLSWLDKAFNESEYQIFRRQKGLTAPKKIAVLPAGSQSYVDTLPGAGEFAYMVAAVNTKGPSDKNGYSSYISVDVLPTENCKYLPIFKQVHFQPLEFSPVDKSFSGAFIQTSLARYVPIRIPSRQATKFNIGKLDKSYERVFPMPYEFYQFPDSKYPFEVVGNGVPSDPKKPPVPLGNAHSELSFMDILKSPKSELKILNNNFSMTYKLWVEDWLWTGEGTTESYPSPTNVRLSDRVPTSREVLWDYDQRYLDAIDGFIVYRSFSCPSNNSLIDWPITVSKTTQDILYSLALEPPGCTCKIQVSAFGPNGETDPSDLPKERCQTNQSDHTLEVTFDTLTIESKILKQAAAGEIYLFADDLHRKSNSLLLDPKLYHLNKIPLDGYTDNNRLTVNIKDSNVLILNFSVSGICNGIQEYVWKPISGSWENINQQVELASADNGCHVSAYIKYAGEGSAPQVGKEPTVYLGNGDKCDLNWQCQSGVCSNNICVPNGDGKAGDFCFTNNHCSNKVCECPVGREGKNCRDWENFNINYGGKCASGLNNGHLCDDDDECGSGNCANNLRCAPENKTGRLGDFCFNNNQCGSKACICAKGKSGSYCKEWDDNSNYDTWFGYCYEWPGKENGFLCKEDDECKSQYCADGAVCAPRDGSGLTGDYCHHNNHCFSGKCDCNVGEPNWLGFCKTADGKFVDQGTCAP